jgi:hypothetical protein
MAHEMSHRQFLSEKGRARSPLLLRTKAAGRRKEMALSRAGACGGKLGSAEWDGDVKWTGVSHEAGGEVVSGGGNTLSSIKCWFDQAGTACFRRRQRA